jgi:hypothetical protein
MRMVGKRPGNSPVRIGGIGPQPCGTLYSCARAQRPPPHPFARHPRTTLDTFARANLYTYTHNTYT